MTLSIKRGLVALPQRTKATLKKVFLPVALLASATVAKADNVDKYVSKQSTNQSQAVQVETQQNTTPLKIQMGGRIYTQHTNGEQKYYTFTQAQRSGAWGWRVQNYTDTADAQTTKALNESINKATETLNGAHTPKNQRGESYTLRSFLMLPEQTRSYYSAQDVKLEEASRNQKIEIKEVVAQTNEKIALDLGSQEQQQAEVNQQTQAKVQEPKTVESQSETNKTPTAENPPQNPPQKPEPTPAPSAESQKAQNVAPENQVPIANSTQNSSSNTAPLKIRMNNVIYTRSTGENGNSYSYVQQYNSGWGWWQNSYTKTYTANAQATHLLDKVVADTQKTFEGNNVPKDSANNPLSKESFLLLPEATREQYMAQDAKVDGWEFKDTETYLNEVIKTPDGEFTRAEVFFLESINQARAEAKAAPLRLSQELNKGCKVYAEKMQQMRKMIHSSNIYGGIQVIANFGGFKGDIIGENIAAGQQNYQQVYNSWYNSDRHKANIQERYSTHLGVARAGNYWIMVVGRPHSSQQK